MIVYTSYYANIKKLQAKGFNSFIAVSGYIPEFYKKLMEKDKNFERIVELSPKKEWFFKWKNGELNNDEYEKLYKETVLEKLNFDEIINKIKNESILLCYEKSGDFCHRYFISEWLNHHGIESKEIIV